MEKLKNLTVIIVTYNTSEKIILDCLNSIDKDVKTLIIENSNNFEHKNKILSEFQNVEILNTGSNLGMGSGNNYGLKHVKTDYALILNPDLTCEKGFFDNISETIDSAKDFTIIGCQYLNDKVFMPAGFFDERENDKFKDKFKNNNMDLLEKVDWVVGCSMLFNLKNFINRRIFDENFFLFFEEFDLCKSVINSGGNIYTSKKLKIHHLGLKSSYGDDIEKIKSLNKLREWHWMWSSFYFYNKNYGYFFALRKTLGKFFKSFVKLIYFSITLNKTKKEKYLYRLLGSYNSIIGKKSNFRIDKK